MVRKRINSRKILGYSLLFILPIVMFIIWMSFEEPLLNPGRSNIGFQASNNLNNGTTNLDIYYKIDMYNGFSPKGDIWDDYGRALKCPVRIEFFFNSNLSLWFSGIDEEQVYWDNIPDDENFDFRWSHEQAHFKWFKKDFPFVNNHHLTLYIDKAITRPDIETFALSIDSTIVSYHKPNLNSTIDLYQEVKLENMNYKGIQIESSNMHFVKSSNSYISDSFEDELFGNFTVDSYFITKIDLDFSTTWSRRRSEISLALLVLIIEIPTISGIDLVNKWIKKKYIESDDSNNRPSVNRKMIYE